MEYDPNWVKEFEIRKQKLAEILGDEVLDIQHIGSTAIPGMFSKPQIDILVVVRDLHNIKRRYDEMLTAGFQPRGDYTGIEEEYFTEDDQRGVRLASVHILPQGHPEIEGQINFRNYLIANENDRNLYAVTKKELFARYRDDYSAYARGKQQVIEIIRQHVDQWAKRIPKSKGR